MKDKSPLDKAKDTLADAADHASDAVSDASDAATKRVQNAKKRADDAQAAARKKISKSADNAQKKASKGSDKASDKVDDLRLRDAGNELEKSANDSRSFLEGNVMKRPVLSLVLVGLLGLLVGRTFSRR